MSLEEETTKWTGGTLPVLGELLYMLRSELGNSRALALKLSN